ncbi:hypothetical protein AB0V79_17130 [Mesorhizobium ciceri]
MEIGQLKPTLARNTIFNYLSQAANTDQESTIVSGGAWGGYWLDTSPTLAPESPSPSEVATEVQAGRGTISFQEKDLYPLIRLWLETKGYVAKDAATKKSGGKWGNPDIVGMNRVEILGCTELEVASCEVKLNDAQWETFIFEAISHKRFSNRSYYCYRTKTPEEPLPKGMEYYAERYRVGLVQITLSDEDLAELKEADESKLEAFIDKVRERFPGLYEPVPLQEKLDLIVRLDFQAKLSLQAG